MSAAVVTLANVAIPPASSFTTEPLRFKEKGVLLFNINDPLVEVRFQYTPSNFGHIVPGIQVPFTLIPPPITQGIASLGWVMNLDLPDGVIYVNIDTTNITASVANATMYYMPTRY